MKGKHDIKIDASRFLKVAGHEWMGCAAHNQVKVSEGAAPENRRVAFVLINPSKYFPVNFPCQDGSEVACQGQCKKKEKRSAAGIKCLFYDQMVREEKQAAAAQEEHGHDVGMTPWMDVAKKELGVTENREPGKDNSRIIEYHQTTTFKATNDETAWCASFVNWCLEQAGFQGKDSAVAKQWLNWGRPVEEPIYGAVATVYFADTGQYHVGFVDGVKGKFVLLLGGNQSHGLKVSVSSFEKAIIKGYRLPSEYKGIETPATEKSGTYASDNAAGTR